VICRNRLTKLCWDLLFDTLMQPVSIEVLHIGLKDTIQLLLMEDEKMIEALSSYTPQKPFTDRIGLRRMSEARAVCQRAKIAVLLLPGIGTANELKEAMQCGAQVVRIATQCTEADVSEEHLEIAKKLGMETVGFLMMAHMRSPEVLVEQARLMESYGADCVYIVDSAGAMLLHDASARVKALKEALSIKEENSSGEATEDGTTCRSVLLTRHSTRLLWQI
jgi:hypothetical protein